MRMSRTTGAGFAAIFAATALARAQGGPPFLTDDPGTPGPRQWEINVSFLTEDRAGVRTFQAPLIDANYGWGERVQLKLEVPWIVQDAERAPSSSGLGRANLGVKWRFLDEGSAFLSVATYPQVAFRTFSSSVRSGLVEPDTSFLLPLILEKDLGFVSVNLEVGREWHSALPGGWIGGLAIGRELGDRFDVAVEVFAESGARLSNADVVWNIGGRWKLTEKVILLVSGGTGLRGSPDVVRSRAQGYLGMQFLFGSSGQAGSKLP